MYCMAGYLNERTVTSQYFAMACSSQLNAPSSDLVDGTPEADKFRQDLRARRSCRKVTYAKTLQSSEEKVRRLDLDALVRSIANDYSDIGSPVTFSGATGLIAVGLSP
jgi:hypothetical protein